MSAGATSEGGERRGGEGRVEGVEEEEEEGWAPVPQVTWSCYNPQRRPLKAANVPRCQQQVVPPSLLSLASSLLLHPPPPPPAPSSSSSPRLRLSLLGGVIHSPCYAARWRNLQLNPKCELGKRRARPKSAALHLSYCPCGLVVHNRVPTGKLSKKKKLGRWMNFCSPNV